MLVLSKSFSVLKAAITPRVLPPDITLVKTNSRLTVFGLLAGGVAGAVAAALSWAFGSTGALIFTALLSIVGGWLCLRIPAWVESTAGEIPVDGVGPKAKRAFPLSVTTTLWANGTIRVETGFLALFIAFVIKSEYTEASGFTQLLLLGVVGVAAGLGGFIGNGLGARLPLSKPETVSILSLAAVAVSTLIAVLAPGLATAAMVGSGRVDRVIAGQGVPGFGDPARTAGGQPGIRVRPERDRAAAVLGVRRRRRPADRRGLVVRSRQRVLDRVRGDHGAVDHRAGAERLVRVRPLAVPLAGLLQAEQALPAHRQTGSGRNAQTVQVPQGRHSPTSVTPASRRAPLGALGPAAGPAWPAGQRPPRGRPGRQYSSRSGPRGRRAARPRPGIALPADSRPHRRCRSSSHRPAAGPNEPPGYHAARPTDPGGRRPPDRSRTPRDAEDPASLRAAARAVETRAPQPARRRWSAGTRSYRRWPAADRLRGTETGCHVLRQPHSGDTGPTRWCDVDVGAAEINCAETPDRRGRPARHRSGPAGADQRPGGYRRNPMGGLLPLPEQERHLADGRSQIFADGQLAYTLEPFSDRINWSMSRCRAASC